MPTKDGSPSRSPSYSEADGDLLVLPPIRKPEKAISPNPEYRLSFRGSNTSLSNLFASTSGILTPKRASTPTGTPATEFSDPLFSTTKSYDVVAQSDGYRSLIIRSFVPHVAVLASSDTEDLLAGKGFLGGFLELVRPYGENVSGKVTIRDSNGLSKTYEDYAIRFTKLKDGIESLRVSNRRSTESKIKDVNGYVDQYSPHSAARLRTGGDISYIDEVLEKHLSYYETQIQHESENTSDSGRSPDTTPPFISPFQMLYLRRLLSGLPMVPHETFSHPVACVIAISSRAQEPIEELRNLYASTNTGDLRVPQWINNDYLRYYVLVHDEEHDDVQKSTMLFDQMKRHFGLQCHLLRLRSSQPAASDDDCVKLPACEWISAAEELSEITRRENFDDLEDRNHYLFESDAAAVRTFVRELVTQSLVPMMERLSATWNDQVASRRRGLSGRFLSLSKKWTAFGSSPRNASSPSGTPGGSSSNYDSLQGFYQPDAPEAIMRKLSDYAFMLRDFKLAQNIYEMLRSDFNNDKAWKYYAGANEMAAITSLLTAQPFHPKSKADGVDQMLEIACYSYLTRCTAPFYALRTLAVGLELIRLRGGSAADDAARWACRILELDLVGPIGYALFTEKAATCFACREGTGTKKWGARRRKTALWSCLASEVWLELQKTHQAERCLKDAFGLYHITPKDLSGLAFEQMKTFLLDLRDAVSARKDSSSALASMTASVILERLPGPEHIEEKDEKLDIRTHRKSLVGMSTAPHIALNPETILTPEELKETTTSADEDAQSTDDVT